MDLDRLRPFARCFSSRSPLRLDYPESLQECNVLGLVVRPISNLLPAYLEGRVGLLLIRDHDFCASGQRLLFVSHALSINVEDWQSTLHPALESAFEHSHPMGSYIGFYSPPIGLSEKSMGVWLHVGVHDSLQSLNEPRI